MHKVTLLTKTLTQWIKGHHSAKHNGDIIPPVLADCTHSTGHISNCRELCVMDIFATPSNDAFLKSA